MNDYVKCESCNGTGMVSDSQTGEPQECFDCDGGVVVAEKRIKPFSSGSQFGDWTSSNCDRCTKGANNTVGPDGWPGCEIEAALTLAYFDDGTVSVEIAERMGCNNPEYEGAYGWPCQETVWCDWWKAEVNNRRVADGLQPIETDNVPRPVA